METVGAAAIGATGAREMNELILAFNTAGVRYLLIGGQAMRLAGMPRFSMDWVFSFRRTTMKICPGSTKFSKTNWMCRLFRWVHAGKISSKPTRRAGA